MRSCLLLLLCISGCTPAVYTRVEPVSFPSTAPRPIVFDYLAREAVALGYAMEYVDPMAGVFHVHSVHMGQRPRRNPRRPVPRQGALRTNLFIVEVGDAGVRISAIGRHVREDGSMHPTLAQELAHFSDAMRARAQALGGQFVPIPNPPNTYQPQQPQQVPPPPQQQLPPSQSLGSPQR